MKRSIVAVSVLALLAVSGSASCSPQPPDSGKPAMFSSTRPPAPKVARVGETLDLMRIGEQQIAVTLVQVINPATVPNGWAEPGKTYIATKLTIKNVGSTTIVGNSNSNVKVVGSDKQEYTADLASVVECRDFVYGWFLIAVGSTAAGCVVFKLPPGVTPAKVTYTPSSGISRDVGEWLNT